MSPLPDRRQGSSFLRKRIHIGIGLWISIAMLPTVITIGIVMGVIFLPRHYRAQKGITVNPNLSGQQNLSMDCIFVAASLHGDENDVTLGPWIQALLYLVDNIGHRNMFLSIYEDGPAPFSDAALEDFSAVVKCNTSIVSGQLSTIVPRAKSPANGKCLKRITHLAEVHNRAIQPLVDPHSPAFSVQFHKLLFIDDIAFDPGDAADLLLSADRDDQGNHGPRKASCATDFVNPLTFSLTEGSKSLSSGIPHFPWYSADKDEQIRDDTLDPRDVARAGSCWGGIVVLEGRWFQPDGMDKSMAVAKLIVHHTNATTPLIQMPVAVTAVTVETTGTFTTKTRPAVDNADHGPATYIHSI